MWSHAATAAAADGPGATGEAKRLPGAAATRCVETSEARSASARSSPSGTGVVLCTHIATRASPSSSGVAARRARPRTASKAKGTVSPSSTSSSSRAGPSSTRRSTPWWRSPLGSRKATVPETGASRRRRVEHHLHPRAVEGVRAPGRVDRRVDDAERRRGGVLGRPRRVRVERVALVEEGREQPLHAGVEQRAHPSSPLPSSSRTTSSNECSPPAALRRESSSRVSSCRRIQPPPG